MTSCGASPLNSPCLVQNLHATFPGGVIDPSVTNMDLYTYHSYNTVRYSFSHCPHVKFGVVHIKRSSFLIAKCRPDESNTHGSRGYTAFIDLVWRVLNVLGHA